VRILASEKWTAPAGGMERSMLEVAEGLSSRGHAMTVMYRNPGEYLPIYESFGATTKQGRSFLIDRTRTLRSAGELVTTALAGARTRPDLVYVNDYQHTPFGALVSAATRSPLVAHLRLTPPAVSARQMRASVPRVQRFIAVSADTRERFSQFGYPRERIDVVYNGVDLTRYSPGSVEERRISRRELGIADDEYLVLYVGRIDAVKGIETLIGAVNQLRERGRRIRLVVVGRPAWHETVEAGERYVAALQQRALSGTAAFIGVQLNPVPLYRAADVVAVPSHWPEPFGRVIVEAMACGRPVVASGVGGIPEILTGELKALLVPPADEAALAARLDAISGHVDDLGQACRDEAEARFGLDTMIDGIEESFSRAGADR
jgi:glycosyltransferase involved in cell wall biosynthesis